MTIFYFDSSALAKGYIEEKGSSIIEYILSHTTVQQWRVLMLGLAETVSIFVRKKNSGGISKETFQSSLRALRDDFVDNQAAIKIETTNGFVLAALPFIIKHSINSTDAVVLHSACGLAADLRDQNNEFLLVTADKRLVTAAEAESLRVINPETATLAEIEAFLLVE
ncbi:type II toxin-antitoxin system VapC family toxin [candidate division KSB1 bacterium]|nr:type II toxin-antitoxin system VapC family toxin [candidate division KSB1 bacterium]